MLAMLVYQENPVGIELFYRVATFTVEQISFVRGNSKITRPEPRLSVLYKFEMLAAWPWHAFTGPLTDSGLTRWSRCSHYVTKNKAPYKRTCTFLVNNSQLYVVRELFHKVWNRSNFWTNNPQHFFLISLLGCILPTIHCRSKYCWELLHPFVHHCQPRHNNSKHCWPNNVGSCCIPLHMVPTTSMDTTIPNIADPTMLGVVASFCTPLPA